MNFITTLPSCPHSLWDYGNDSILLAFTDGLAVLDAGTLNYIFHGGLDGVSRGPDRCYYGTQGNKIIRIDVERDGVVQDISAAFSGQPAGRGQVVCAAAGDIWVEGCGTRKRSDGSFIKVPGFFGEFFPVPSGTDIYGNVWSLAARPEGKQVLVWPANGPQQWQAAWLALGEWDFLFADSVGFIWVIGASGWRRFCPRQSEKGWQHVDDLLPSSVVTAVGMSPDQRLMAAFANGELWQLDTNADGGVVTQILANLPAAGRCVHTDRHGVIWVATDQGLYRSAVATDAWQQTWEKKWGRLPGGGNHDIFATQDKNKLFIAGGWAGAWGLPPRDHVGDELFVYDAETEYWQVVSHMYEPRRYNGIATLEEEIWVIGGETRNVVRGGEGQVLYLVDIYNPASASWRPGPSLNVARTDPFVVTCHGRIYAIGGAAHNSGPILDSVESIGPNETVWRFETALPQPTRQGHGCVLEGIIYCISIDGVFAFDTSNGCWDDALPQPGTIGQGPLAAAYQGEVWLIGGYEDQQVRCYNPKDRVWRRGPDLPAEQAWGAAIVMDDELFVIGGARYSKSHASVVFDDRTYVLRRSIGAAE